MSDLLRADAEVNDGHQLVSLKEVMAFLVALKESQLEEIESLRQEMRSSFNQIHSETKGIAKMRHEMNDLRTELFTNMKLSQESSAEIVGSVSLHSDKRNSSPSPEPVHFRHDGLPKRRVLEFRQKPPLEQVLHGNASLNDAAQTTKVILFLDIEPCRTCFCGHQSFATPLHHCQP